MIIKVRNKNGNVLEGITVKLDDGAVLQTGTTDTNGDIVFTVQLLQNYTLSVSHPGYKTYRHKFSLEENASWDLSIDPVVSVIIKDKGFGIVANPEDPENEIIL